MLVENNYDKKMCVGSLILGAFEVHLVGLKKFSSLSYGRIICGSF
jgi:hypothetical protein